MEKSASLLCLTLVFSCFLVALSNSDPGNRRVIFIGNEEESLFSREFLPLREFLKEKTKFKLSKGQGSEDWFQKYLKRSISETEVLISLGSKMKPFIDYLERREFIRIIFFDERLSLGSFEAAPDALVVESSALIPNYNSFFPTIPTFGLDTPNLYDELLKIISKPEGFVVPKSQSLGLVMIVKNEERLLRETLESCKDDIDDWTILDTGSTDRTKEIISEVFDGDIKGHLYEGKFVDFSTTRNEAFRLHSNKTAYALLLNGDDRAVDAWKMKKATDRVVYYCSKTAQEAEVITGELIEPWKLYLGGFSCRNSFHVPRSVRSKSNVFLHIRLTSVWDGQAGTPNGWYFRHKTHEILTQPVGANVIETENFGVEFDDFVTAYEDKTARYLDDIRLLEEEMAEGSPENRRTQFYYAQSFQSSGNYERALYEFDRYLAIATWPDEMYWARLQQILSLSKLKRDYVVQVASSFTLMPGRVEAFTYLEEIFLNSAITFDPIDPYLSLQLKNFTYQLSLFCSQFPVPKIIGFVSMTAYHLSNPNMLASTAWHLATTLRSPKHWYTGIHFANKVLERYPTDETALKLKQYWFTQEFQKFESLSATDAEQIIDQPTLDLGWMIEIGDDLFRHGNSFWADICWRLRAYIDFPSYQDHKFEALNMLQRASAFVRLGNAHGLYNVSVVDEFRALWFDNARKTALPLYAQAMDIQPTSGAPHFFQGTFLRFTLNQRAAFLSLKTAYDLALAAPQQNLYINNRDQLTFTFDRLMSELCAACFFTPGEFGRGMGFCQSGMIYPSSFENPLLPTFVTDFQTYFGLFNQMISGGIPIQDGVDIVQGPSTLPPTEFANKEFALVVEKDDNAYFREVSSLATLKPYMTFHISSIHFLSNFVELTKKNNAFFHRVYLAVFHSVVPERNVADVRLAVIDKKSHSVLRISIPLKLQDTYGHPIVDVVELKILEQGIISVKLVHNNHIFYTEFPIQSMEKELFIHIPNYITLIRHLS